MSRSPEIRLMRVITASQWLALVLGIITGIVVARGSAESFVAAATAGLYVLVATAVPTHVLRRPLALEALSLSGALLTMTSVALTGAVQSPYLLLSIIPAVAATTLGGIRTGLATATLSGALIVAISLSRSDAEVGSAIGIAALFLVVSFTVGHVRRLLDDIERRAHELERNSVEAEKRLAELTTTNELLTRLASLASENTGPIAVGRTALEAIEAMVPNVAATAMLRTAEGSVVIAQSGDHHSHPVKTRIPLRAGGREVGSLLLATDSELDPVQRSAIDKVAEPVALSFANLLLLQEIATVAVREERTRLARELHDEIGPTLASLGLALDTAALESGDATISSHLAQLRTSVGSLVEDVRATVADLRSSQRGSLSSRLNEALHDLPTPPEVDIGIDERRPPRPSIVNEVFAVIAEATRNACLHSGSDRVRITGWVDFDRGRLKVEDRGRGFDPAKDFDGHYGLVGMKERADRINGTLGITSDDEGTIVTLEWGQT